MRNCVTTIALLAMLLAAAAADQRGPSTPEERKRALNVIEQLEQRPLDPSLKQDREWVFQWLKEVPDVNASVCTGILGPLLEEKPTDVRGILTYQNVLASAAFKMEHPEKARDHVSVFMAGAEGMLRTYDNILKKDPALKSPFMEELKQKQASGTLLAYVKQGAETCAKHSGTSLKP
jgi:hypothetical protein